MFQLMCLIFTSLQLISANIIINNKSVVCIGGPGTMSESDLYNSIGNWNRTYQPSEPQQIHASWLSEGTSFRVQFSTRGQVERSILQYWAEEFDFISEIETVVDSKDWVFVDEGAGKSQQHMHMMKTNRLKPSTIYKYQVITISKEYQMRYISEVFEIKTPGNYLEPVKFLAIGDIGLSNAVSMPILKSLAHDHEYDFVAIMGDQAYDLADFNGTKGDRYLNFAQELYANLPILTTAGNHEKAYNFSHYKERFDLLPYRESNFQNSLQFSINFKSLHLISFFTEAFFGGSEEEIATSLRWLEEDLINANKVRSRIPWIVVIGHRPLYCSIPNDPDCLEDAETLRFGHNKSGGLETLLTKYNVDLYICGHKHNYERSYPIKNNTLVTKSYHNSPQFFQVITGSSGNYNGPESFNNSSAPPDWVAHRYEGYGYSSFEVAQTYMHLHHYKSNIDGSSGGLIDSVRISKTSSFINKQKINAKK